MILANRNRLNSLESIAECYLELVYDLANIKIVEVASAVKLSDEQQAQLTTKLQSVTGAKEILLLTIVDSSLIGGFCVKTNSKVIDLSIKGQINELATHLNSVLEF